MATGYSFSGEDHQDLVMEIFSRTSVKSIIRCTSVCKSWCTLIKSSYFITKHLNRSRKALSSNVAEEAPLFLICNKGLREWMLSYITSTFNNNETEEVAAALSDSLRCRKGLFIPTTMGPINGIYCWTSKEKFEFFDDLVLCNPGLREVKAIPKVPRSAVVPSASDGLYYVLSETYGFGYDPNTNDYKVVAVTGARYGYPYGLQIFVYTLSSSNSWRKLQIDLDDMPAFPDRQTNPVLTDGNRVCHWLAKDKQQHRVMLSFDFGSEAFKSSPLSQGRGWDLNKSGLYLSVLNESSIILIAVGHGWSRHDIRFKTGCCYEIYMMNEGGTTGEELWAMLFTIEPIPGVDKPLGFRKNGEIILAKFDGSLVTYDPSCEQINPLHICPEGFQGYQVCTYMESLVSIHGRSGGA